MVLLVGPEDHALGGIEVAGGHVEVATALPAELAEVVGHPDAREVLRQPALERRVVEDPARHVVERRGERALGRDLLEDRHRELLERRVARLQEELADRRPERLGQPRHPPRGVAREAREIGQELPGEPRRAIHELAQVRAVEVEGGELGEALARALQNLDHLVRRDARRQGHRQHGAHREPHVEVEIDHAPLDQVVVQGAQAAHLEGAARNGPTREHQSRPRPLGRRALALPDQCQPHRLLRSDPNSVRSATHASGVSLGTPSAEDASDLPVGRFSARE